MNIAMKVLCGRGASVGAASLLSLHLGTGLPLQDWRPGDDGRMGARGDEAQPYTVSAVDAARLAIIWRNSRVATLNDLTMKLAASGWLQAAAFWCLQLSAARVTVKCSHLPSPPAVYVPQLRLLPSK